MKKLMIIGAAALVAMAVEARAMSLAEARGRIDAAIENEGTMADIVGQLAPSDQVSFLNSVNAAIGAKPGAPAQKAADYLNANRAAVKAAKGNRTALLAETFATVPPEALTVINERFASELFSRTANPARPTSDDRMTNIAVTVFQQIESRNAAADNADVRNAFAILMFLRASEGSPANLEDILLSEVDNPAVRDTAKNEWFPAAMGRGQPKSYDPMLGAGGVDADQPDFDLVARLATPEAPVALLADLGGRPGDIATVRATLGPGFASLPVGMGDDSGLDRIPRSLDSDDPWFGGSRRGSGDDGYSGGGSGGGGGGGNKPVCHWVDSRDGSICKEPDGYYCQWICD